LEDRWVPEAHGFLSGGVGLLNIPHAAVVQTVPVDKSGLENQGEGETSGPDTDTVHAGPGSQTEDTGNTSHNTTDNTSGGTADNSPGDTAANNAVATRATFAATVLPARTAHHAHHGPHGHHR
jgi:hypothetical protein